MVNRKSKEKKEECRRSRPGPNHRQYRQILGALKMGEKKKKCPNDHPAPRDGKGGKQKKTNMNMIEVQ